MFSKRRPLAANSWRRPGIFFACLALALLFFSAGCVPSSAVQPTTTQGLPVQTLVPSKTRPASATPTASPSKTLAAATPESKPSETRPAAGATPLPAGAVIVIHQEGGIAGVDNTWDIFQDGRIQENGKLIGTLPKKELDQLLDEIKQSGFFDFDHPEAGSFCCDFFTVTVTVGVDSMAHTISVSDGDPEIPVEIDQVLSLLLQAVSS